MCGKFVQYQGVANYLKVLGTDRLVVSGYDNQLIARYNVAPSTRVNILHNQQDDLRVDPVRWGWAPFWAKAQIKTMHWSKQSLLESFPYSYGKR